MSCPLIGHIAVITNTGMAAEGLDAVRVQHRSHDIILLNPTPLLWSAIRSVMSLVSADELPLLLWGVPCSCYAGLRAA